MVQVASCLGCCKLETGALVIGWLHFIGSILGTVIFMFFTADMYNNPNNCIYCRYKEYYVDIAFLHKAVVLLIGCAAISFCCIRGIWNRNHLYLLPFLVQLAFEVAFSLLDILSFTATGIVVGIIDGFIYTYFFIVIYSLFDRFRQEHEKSLAVAYSPTAPVDKV